MNKQKTPFYYVISCLILLGALPASGTDYSARIRALGGSTVAGIIPDTLTDISINPAYLSLVRTRKIILQINSDYPQHIYFPTFQNYLASEFTRTIDTKRLLLEGPKLKDWSTAISVMWHQDEYRETEPNVDQRVYEDEISYSINSEDFQKAQNLWNAQIMLSRFISRNRVIGLNFRSGSLYCKRLSTRSRYFEKYDYPLTEPEQIEVIEKSMREEDTKKRVFNSSLQLSLITLNNDSVKSEVSLTFSRKDIYRDFLYEDSSSDTYFNTEVGILSDHDYSDRKKEEKKTGDIYSVSLHARRFTDSGIIILGNLGFSTGTFTSYWNNYYEYYHLERSESMDRTTYSCDGSYNRISVLLNGGKTFKLHKKLFATTGVYAHFEKTWTEEKPVIRYTYNLEDLVDTVSVQNNSLHRIASNNLSAVLSFPISFEFKPSQHLSLYAAYVVQFIYEQKNIFFKEPELTMNIGDIQYLGYDIKGEENKSLYDNTVITAGFNFRISNRATIDLYTRYGFDILFLRDAAADFIFSF